MTVDIEKIKVLGFNIPLERYPIDLEINKRMNEYLLYQIFTSLLSLLVDILLENKNASFFPYFLF